MLDVTLDITPFEEKIPLHRYLKEQLDFPFYYGGNLDALYDELSSMTDAIHITLCYATQPKGKMIDYTPRLLRVFDDAARENYNLTLTIKAVDP
ncbi:MAG: barstar family protein [Eubacteriales bacterium]|nr:barstar family protein [Eubacteriales bacterium]